MLACWLQSNCTLLVYIRVHCSVVYPSSAMDNKKLIEFGVWKYMYIYIPYKPDLTIKVSWLSYRVFECLFFFLGYVLILILFIIENNIDSVEWCTNNVCVKLLRLSKYLFSIFWRLIEIFFFRYFKWFKTVIQDLQK